MPQDADDRLVGERVAVAVEQLDPELRLEHVGEAAHGPGVAQRGTPRRPVDEDRRQLVVVVLAAHRVVEDHALAAEHGHGFAVELEQDAVDRRELGERVHDLGEPGEDRRAAAAGLELARQVDRRDAVRDRQAEQGRAVGDGGVHRGPGGHLGVVRTLEERAHRRGRHGLGTRDLAEHRDEALVAREAAQDEVGTHDRRASRASPSGAASGWRWVAGSVPGEPEPDGAAVALGVADAVGDGEERSGVASADGTSTDGSTVAGGVAGVPSGPTVGAHAPTSAAITRRTRAGANAWPRAGSAADGAS